MTKVERALAASARHRRRVAKFILVGTLCLFVQLQILMQLKSAGVLPIWADAVAFLASAQLNFVLSYLWTWGDSRRVKGYDFLMRWMMFIVVTFFAMWINAGVYDGLQGLVGDYAAVIVAIVFSSLFTFVANHNVIFPQERKTVTRRVGRRMPYDSIAWFLPAHNESVNLELVVPEVVSHLRKLKCPFDVIIVNDGSTDGTRMVSEQLADDYPEVSVVHHEQNYGYGAALKTGLQSGLESGHSLIGFMDADMQFRIRSLDPMLDEIDGVDLVLGYRLKRADNNLRRLFSWAWHHFSQMILDFTATDTDCGFKLFRQEVVETLLPELRGQFATISAELIARAQRAGFSIAEVGVEHYPRNEGEQSGANIKVIAGSFVDLLHTRRAIGRGE